MNSKNDDETIIASKCFCGRNLSVNRNISAVNRRCGSTDCDVLAKKFGTVSNWLVSNVKEIANNNTGEIVLSKIESRIVKYLNETKIGVSQKTITLNTGLAKSTVSKTLIGLEKKEIVIKNYDFFAPKGKEITLYYLDI